MDDLIRRQDVIDYVLEHGFYCDTEADKEYTAELIRTVFPSADAVEVVRCKDCRYKPVGTGCNHDLEFPVHYKCPCECDDYWYSWMPKDDFFCGNGERKKTDG